MQKPFTQITFDFTSPEIEKEEKIVLPVKEEINDVVNEIISSQQETISNLKDYLYSNA